MKMMQKVYQHPDGGEVHADYYPKDFDRFLNKPIIVFLYGAFGYEKAAYVQAFLKIMKKNNWRGIFLNRRGFNLQELKNDKLLEQDELQDFLFIFEQIKKQEKNASLYLIGVSAGACYGTILLNKYPEKMPFKAFISIANPFNATLTSFHMDRKWYTKFISNLITIRAKKIINFHSQNKFLQKKLKKKGVCLKEFSGWVQKKQTLWEMDNTMTKLLINDESIFDYYMRLSCDKEISNIKIPCLFINSENDPISLPEFIPIDSLYKNPNTFTIITSQGGHGLFLSGWKMEYHIFNLAFEYFQFMEKNQQNS